MNQHTHPIHADNPVPGWFKKRLHKDGPWVPVYIGAPKDGGPMQALVGDGQGGRTQVPALDIWTWVAGNPVDEQEARHAFKTGSWPGDIGIGDNSGDMSILDELDDMLEQARDFLKSTPVIQTKVEADRAGNFRERVTKLKSGADSARKDEKQPHLDACREIDARYAPHIDAATSVTNDLRRVLTGYLAAEEARTRAAAKAAEDAARAAIAATGAQTDIAVNVEAPKVNVGGQHGKRIGLKSQTVYEIGNYAALLAAVADHPDVREVALKVAKARAKTGVEVPGLTTRVERVAQ